MSNRTLVLEELQERTVEDGLREVVKHQERLTVRLPEGETVAIQLSKRLKPLPALDGFIPGGWKDAI
jgi:hypothetical protein